MGTAAPQRLPPLSTRYPSMTRDLATSLLNRAATGDQLLTIQDSIVEDVTAENIADCAAHYAAISAPTSDPIAF